MASDSTMINLKKQNILIFALVALLIVLIVPTLSRFYRGNDSLISGEPYYHLRAAGVLAHDSIYNFFNPPGDIPDATYSPRNYYFNPYHFLLAYSSKLMPLITASRVVPLLLGILSVLLFNIILKRHFVAESYNRHVIVLLLVLNPAFIYTFTVSNPNAAAIALTLLGFFLFLQKGRFNILLALFCFAIVSLFSLFNTLFVILLLLAYVLTKKDKQSRFMVVLLFLAIFSFARNVSLFYNYTFTPNIDVLGNLFSDLGGIIGFGIFSVVLAVYGVVSFWKEKSGFIYFFLLALLLFVALFFIGNIVNMYLMFLLAVSAGIGFIRLYEFQWSIDFVKNLTLLIIICGLVFSAVSYMTRLGSMEPDRATIASLDWMMDNSFKDSYVLSHYDNGYLISTVARSPVLADSLYASDYDQRFLYKVEDALFYSRNLKQARTLLDVYKIKYIYVSPEMKSGLVWSKSNEGLLFLFTNTKNFRKIYDTEDTQIWEVINETSGV